MSAAITLLKRDLKLALREGGAIGTALGFYLVVISILPLGLGPDLNLLSRIAPGILWVALLLAALLSLGRIFETDYEDGTLEVLALGNIELALSAAVKSLAHWITTAIPLTLMTPVLGLLLNLDINAYGVLMLSMLVGTPAISFIGAIGGALTLQARRGGLLLSLLLLPLYVPSLILGILTVSAVILDDGSFASSLALLAAYSLLSIVLAPFAAAAAIRLQLG